MRRVALLVATSILTSACAVLGFGGECVGTEVIGKFDQVGDLVIAANVQSSDVVIGSITDISLDEGNWQAAVTMCLEPDEKISKDVRAVVRSTSLLGEKFVDLQTMSPGPPFLQSGAVIGSGSTDKATELEDVFAELATILGTGNLENLNRLTTAQANILRGNEDKVREVMRRLRRFTDVLASRTDQIASGVDSLDSVAKTALGGTSTLQTFLRSFADSSGVLNRQKESLENLLITLDRFTAISIRLLDKTEAGLNEQFAKLRPVLRTAVANSKNLAEALRTLATFSQWFPETMPGDYLQLDVCQAPETLEPGVTCPQAIGNDDPDRRASSGLEFILMQPLEGGR